jgi:proteic killer suppression protein
MSFADKRLQRLFTGGETKGLPAEHVDKIDRLLELLDKALVERDLYVSGYHRLRGNRSGTAAWKISRNWRLTFRFEKGEAFDVRFVDYH